MHLKTRVHPKAIRTAGSTADRRRKLPLLIERYSSNFISWFLYNHEIAQSVRKISDVLATGEEVKLTTLGRFEICGRAYKMFFDPEAKAWFDAPTRLDVYFHPSKKLTDFIDYNLRQKA